MLICPKLEDSRWKHLVILDVSGIPHGNPYKAPAVWDEAIWYQLVGEVTAHQGFDA